MGRKSITHNRPFHSQASLPFGGPVLSDALLSGKKSKQHNSCVSSSIRGIISGAPSGLSDKEAEKSSATCHKVAALMFSHTENDGVVENVIKVSFSFFPPLFVGSTSHGAQRL